VPISYAHDLTAGNWDFQYMQMHLGRGSKWPGTDEYGPGQPGHRAFV